MSLHYLMKHNMCQSVHNHSNASIKRHDKLSYGQTHRNKCSKCLPLALTRALRRFRHWLIAWYVMLCWIPDHAKIVSSGTFTEYLSVWCIPQSLWPLWNASFPGDLTGSFVCPWCTLLTECQIIGCINVLSTTWCVRCATARLSICCAGFSLVLRR